jgi:hypothetical protein
MNSRLLMMCWFIAVLMTPYTYAADDDPIHRLNISVEAGMGAPAGYIGISPGVRLDPIPATLRCSFGEGDSGIQLGTELLIHLWSFADKIKYVSLLDLTLSGGYSIGIAKDRPGYVDGNWHWAHAYIGVDFECYFWESFPWTFYFGLGTLFLVQSPGGAPIMDCCPPGTDMFERVFPSFVLRFGYSFL